MIGMDTRKRTKIAIDASPEIQEALRKVAANEYRTVRVAVLTALAEKYPDLKPLIDKELKAI